MSDLDIQPLLVMSWEGITPSSKFLWIASTTQDSRSLIIALTPPPRPLLLLTQAIQAGQVTVEHHLMSDHDIQPLLVVG